MTKSEIFSWLSSKQKDLELCTKHFKVTITLQRILWMLFQLNEATKQIFLKQFFIKQEQRK